MALLAAELIALIGFTTKTDNTWFPLKPGTTLVYKGVKDGKPQRDLFKVTKRRKVVGGVRSLVVDDRVYASGHLGARTSDYYVQDASGNVGYYGEDTAGLDSRAFHEPGGHLAHRRPRARSGIFMPAHPRVGESHRQEDLKGHAEDQFEVLSRDTRIRTPYRSFRHALRTKEWTRLEPAVVDNKYYVRGIGEVFEGSVRGPKETAVLVSVRRR